MKLILFDLDNTLLGGDSDYNWGLFLAEKGIVDPIEQARKNQEFYDDYRAGKLDIFAFLQFQLGPLAGRSQAELAVWHAEFMHEKIEPILLPKAQNLIDSYLADADCLVAIVTATNRFVTAPIAQKLGISHLIATDLEIKNGLYTGNPAGVPCFQAGKIQRVEMWLHALGQTWTDFSESWFYSDSCNDLPLLEKVTHPVAVDADEKLTHHAQTHQWSIISLR